MITVAIHQETGIHPAIKSIGSDPRAPRRQVRADKAKPAGDPRPFDDPLPL